MQPFILLPGVACDMLVASSFSLGESTDKLVNMFPVLGYESDSFERVASNTFLHEIAINDLGNNILERNATHC